MTATPSLDAFLATFPSNTRIGVAVSGGSDSMALLHMLAHARCMVCACTVHHHLRAEASDEAAFVADYCAAHDVPHEVVHWHWDGQGNLQDQARRARYGLLSDWATQQRLSHVTLGHTADDNIETFLMGLTRGAGLDGLSGMRPRFERAGVSFHRPLLSHRRNDLRDFLVSEDIVWQDDPSNENPDYHRIQMRQAQAQLAELGLTPEMLTKSLSNLQATRRDIELMVADEARRYVTIEHGDVCIDLDWLTATTDEFRRRILNAALVFVSAQDYPPRAAKLAQVMADIHSPATLHGCTLTAREGTLRVARELAAVVEKNVSSQQVWDRRWQFDGPHSSDMTVQALGEDGIACCQDTWRDIGLPRTSILASPSVWNGSELVAAPMAGWSNGWHLRLVTKPPAALASILSH